MMSCSRIGAMNFIVSIATVAVGPWAARPATMPAAMSIWLSTQPPKIWPLELMSPGRGATRKIGSRESVVIVIFRKVLDSFVMAGAGTEEHQPHQRSRQQHRKENAARGEDQERDRERAPGLPQDRQTRRGRHDRSERHPCHQ